MRLQLPEELDQRHNDSLLQSMASIKSAVRDGSEVLEKCIDRSSERRLKHFIFSREYIKKLVRAGTNMQSVLSSDMLSIGIAAKPGAVSVCMKELQQQNEELQQMERTYRNEVLDEIQHQCTQGDALPKEAFQKLVALGVVSNRQDYVCQLEAITTEVEELRNNRENLPTNQVSTNASLLADNNVVQMIEQLSLKDSEIL
jgi:hypothetical protein